jgi:hypothetical protein
MTLFENIKFKLKIDTEMVQHLDRNLHIGGAVKEVYDELVKTLQSDYLRFDLVILAIHFFIHLVFKANSN